MARDKSELYVTVPSFFKCPISMDVMKSPVSLCTGVTYDRASITTWLDSGHNTCPATMQVLQSTDVVPNLTLRRLIRVWSDSLLLRPPPDSASSPPWIPAPAVSKQQLLDSVKSVRDVTSLANIVSFAKYSDENREFLANFDGFLPAIYEVLREATAIQVIEQIVAVLDLIVSESRVKKQLHQLMFSGNNGDCLPAFLSLLQQGSLTSKISSARVLESISFNADSQLKITEKQGLLQELYNLIRSESDQTAMQAGLSALIALATTRKVKKELVRFGIVRTAGRILSSADAVFPVIEKAMKALEMVSACTEGRTAICDDGGECAAAVVRKLMKVSPAATEHGVAVLWSVCCLSRDQAAREAAMRVNGLTKVLLVMQSGCSAGVRQMCGDLVKVFRVNSRSCLASYETRTTHIMPY
ncbi:hypothetical protein RJ639_017271 [Escallonia herrerae]|uniref:U-box domain-containing protein n=1 Tax=Escallonia herrerae TaxID=1293975 RepID=A0AA88VC77_9ASTE|nr:hypothetical protein RJ639_017271 [Escallonia herrerae]